MIVGVPREIKSDEKRVAITPTGVMAMVAHGHQVYVESDAGLGSQITNADYEQAGAEILPTADEVWSKADMIMKVKEPLAPDYPFMKDKLIFTYLHLAAAQELTGEMLKSNCI
ncbi:alanine dehydrogenase, partial [bacterium]|nr:alanine dehydrogenase [bacterium]